MIVTDVPDRTAYGFFSESEMNVGHPRAKTVFAHQPRVKLWQSLILTVILFKLFIGERNNLLAKRGKNPLYVKREKGSPQIPQQFSGFLDCLFSIK